jgi:hypothetical protein
MCSEIKNCIDFVVNSNIFLIYTGLICVGCLKSADTNNYLLVLADLTQSIPKRPHFLYRSNGIGLAGRYQR